MYKAIGDFVMNLLIDMCSGLCARYSLMYIVYDSKMKIIPLIVLHTEFKLYKFSNKQICVCMHDI